MKIGANIKTLREEKKMTQKDLAEKLFLSPQAISRYEKDEVEPNLDIIEKLAEIFDCTTDEILHGKKDKKEDSKESNNTAIINTSVPQSSNQSENIIIKCHDCGRIIQNNEQSHDVTRFKDGARFNTFVCEECYQKGLELDRQKESITNQSNKKKSHKLSAWNNNKSIVTSLICGVVVFIVSLCLLLTLGKNVFKPGVSVGLSFLNLYLVISLLYCIFVDTIVRDMFFEISLTSVKIPVYFISADLIDNVVIAIPLKITSFILGLCATACLICIAIVLSGIVSMFIYPFTLISHCVDGK